MECREFEKTIPEYLKKNLDYETMESFWEHMDHCDSCKEELSIQFLVLEGMKHLENGDSFDLDAEFRNRLEMSRRANKRRGMLMNFGQWVLTFVFFLFGCVFIIIFG